MTKETIEEIKSDYTPYQQALYTKIENQGDIDDNFDELVHRLNILGSLELSDISSDLGHSIYLLVYDIEQMIRAVQLRTKL